MAITSHLSVLLLCSILCQVTKKISSVVSAFFIRGFVESFENSSFTRPSGGAFEVKLAKIQKMKKGFVELYLSFIVTEFRH